MLLPVSEVLLFLQLERDGSTQKPHHVPSQHAKEEAVLATVIREMTRMPIIGDLDVAEDVNLYYTVRCFSTGNYNQGTYSRSCRTCQHESRYQ